MKVLVFFLALLSSVCAQAEVKTNPSLTSKKYSNIWLVTEFNLRGFNWSDLGLEHESSFTGPLNEAWKKWILQNMGGEVEGVEICEIACRTFLSAWETGSLEESLEEERYKNGLWLKMTIDLKRAKTSTVQEFTFEWETRGLLLDIVTRLSLGSADSPARKKTWRGMEQKAMNSALASLIYRTSLSDMDKVLKGLSSKVQINTVITLRVEGHKHLSDVMALVELLKDRGRNLGIEVKLKSFQGKEASVLCYFKGEEKAFSDLLSQLKGLKSSQSYRLESGRSGNDYFIKLTPE